MTEADNEMSKALKKARMMYLTFIVGVIIVAFMNYVFLSFDGDTSISLADDPTMTTMVVAMGVFELAVFIGLFLFPRQTLRIINKIYKNKAEVLFKAAELRGGLFMAAAIFGIILGIFGAGEAITIPFFLAAAALLVFTFPTEEKWRKWQETLGVANPSNPEE